MSALSKIDSYNCIHSTHLFADPLCREQSLLQRISNVVFHILTLGVPLAIYHMISSCRTFSVQQNKGIQPYPALGQEALEFARKKLKEHPELAPTHFGAGWSGKTHQPVNPEIALLTTLLTSVAEKNFIDLLKQNKENPWSNQEVIKAADEGMKIAYAISNLTLDDLKPFIQQLPTKDKQRTYAGALVIQDSYQYRTFYYCTNIYHLLRGQVTWGAGASGREEFTDPESISKEHADAFYQPGTIQNSWNQLYNNYCDRIDQYVGREALEHADGRHSNWTEKDTGIGSFRSYPGTRPT